MYSQQKSLNFGQYVPNDKVLNRKVPENPRYRNVKPAVDTGKNVKRHIDELKEKQKGSSHKKNEVFYRIKFSTFIKLATTVAEDILKQESGSDYDAEECVGSRESKKEEKNKIANVLIGIGEIDLRNEKKKPPAVIKPVETRVPYLLLDVRDQDKFLQCHIKTAKHYPVAMLSRSIGYEIEDMKLYKNNSPELIIIYDEDESIASRVATTLVQRGYENVYILSGGLKRGFEVLPRGLMMLILTSASNTLSPNNHVKTTQVGSFSEEDIYNIQQYIDDYPQKENPGCISRSHTSKGYQSTGDTGESSSRHDYNTNRTGSAGSKKCNIPTRSRTPNRIAADGTSISRKVPWK